MTDIQFCVHGHFYQPPREDPFIGEIPTEYGAGPYRNWTERIFNECYLPNAQVGNFQKISFNIGPTLLAWMEKNHPETLKKIVKQENLVFQRTGVSNAMVQPYIHLIMPLASPRDQNTVIHWGIKDFERRFGHTPKGLWLPETAVNRAALQTLADHDIQFTILAPWQAKDPQLDTTQAYRVPLENDKEIIVFFYNAFLSGEISFNQSASENADTFVQDWLLPQSKLLQRGHEQLIMAASDGELYGHHQPHREQFLSYLVDGAAEKAEIEHFFPALWLRDHDVTQRAEIKENTSWSCHHGIERWRNVCGDAPSATWKKPVRDFLDGLASEIDDLHEKHLDGLIRDPWALRDDYIDVLGGSINMDELLSTHATAELDSQQKTQIATLLQVQFDRLRMFSSDAWFYYDLDRIETLNALKYAAHATGMIEQITGRNPCVSVIDILAKAHSEVSSLTGDVAFLGYLKKFEMLQKNT